MGDPVVPRARHPEKGALFFSGTHWAVFTGPSAITQASRVVFIKGKISRRRGGVWKHRPDIRAIERPPHRVPMRLCGDEEDGFWMFEYRGMTYKEVPSDSVLFVPEQEETLDPEDADVCRKE